ncbi:MAG: methyltransferase domain-containing protein [Bacteroidetes bacterium]|nr:methyltransferase domain-containing protein [Bacteroidota bacterium]
MTPIKINLTAIFLLITVVSFCQEKIDKDEIDKVRKTWNKAFVDTTANFFNKKPNELLMETVKGKKPGKALDIGMGQGRNSIFLAKNGWKVTGIDIADEAMKMAIKEAERNHVQIDTIVTPMETFDYGINQWDLVVRLYEGCLNGGADMDKVAKSLKKGGLFVFEFFHIEAGIEMKRPDFGCTSANVKEIVEKTNKFKILSYSENKGVADYSLKTLKLIKLVAKKK